MFNWLKNLFGSKQETLELTPEMRVEETIAPKAEQAEKPAKTKKQAKRPAKKGTVDLDSLNKTQLLEEAKKRGVKANASLKKDEILKRLKDAG
jgi:hypothetical protein